MSGRGRGGRRPRPPVGGGRGGRGGRGGPSDFVTMERNDVDTLERMDLGRNDIDTELEGEDDHDAGEGELAQESAGGGSLSSVIGTTTADSTPAGASSVDDSLVLDFRENALPGCIEIVESMSLGDDSGSDQSSGFIAKKDGSTCYKLAPGHYMKVNLEGLEALGGKKINDYTLTMDVLLDSLPNESLALFNTNNGRMTEGEAFIYAGGGVGVFGEVGVPEAAVREQRWTRVVITLGNAPRKKPAPRRRNALHSHVPGYSSSEDEDEGPFGGVGGPLSVRGMGMGMGMGSGMGDDDFGDRGGHDFGERPKERLLTTYVNSKKCAVISSNYRGVVAETDGRFSINPQELFLFGSNSHAAMPGLTVRYVELRRGCLSEERVKLEAQKNRLYSTWEKDRQAELDKLRGNLALSALFKTPPPIWAHPSIMSEFADAYLEGSGLEGGDLSMSSAVYSLLVERLLLSEGHGLFEATSHASKQAINYLSTAFKSGKDLFRKYGLVVEAGGGNQLIHFMKRFKKIVEELKEGEVMLIPGGIGQRVVLYVLEKELVDSFRFTVVNSDPNGGLEYHTSNADDESTPNIIKYHTVLTIKDVKPDKMMDDAFWGLLFKLSTVQSKFNSPEKLYDLLLPYLVDKPCEQIVAESSFDTFSEFRAPQLSYTASYRVLEEASYYLLRRRGVSVADCRLFAFAVRTQSLKFMEQDLGFMSQIRDNDRRVVSLAAQQLALLAAQLGEDGLLSDPQLTDALDLATLVKDMCESVPCEDADRSAYPPALELVQASKSTIKGIEQQHVQQPYMDRLVRSEDVDGLAGAPIVLPQYVPVDFLLMPKRAANIEEAIAAIRFCDRLCTLISVQGHCVKNRAFHKMACIEHLLTHILPMPKPETAADAAQCLWRTPMRYGVQLDLTICLGRILEHFISATYSCQMTKSKDSLNLVITGCVAALVDVILRKAATDQPSEFCLHLMGSADPAINQAESLGRGSGYGISMAGYAAQSETLRLHTSEQTVARTAVLDYFDAQKARVTSMFNWQDNHRLEPAVCEFLAGLCQDLAFPQGEKAFVGYITASNQLVNKNYPEFHVYRDVAFYLKFVQNVDPRAFPAKNQYTQMSVELKWGFDEGMFMVEAFQRGFTLRCYPEPPLQDATHRYASTANPSVLASPHQINTEDDVLHVKNLPSFKDCLGQQDAELLLSYLTVPYLRVPLVLSLFATEDRIHSLRSEELQEVLEAVLFEPGKYLPSDEDKIPAEVPTPNRRILSTAFGLLFNELYRSPEVLMDSVLTLTKLAVNLDVGTVHSSTVPIVLFVLRLVARVDSFATYLINHSEGSDVEGSIFFKLRGIKILPETLSVLKAKREELAQCVKCKVHGMLEAWCKQLSIESSEKTDDEVIDANARTACKLHGYLLLLHRNVTAEEYTFDVASIISSSFLYLTSRHTWNLDVLGIPENEVFEMMMVQRRNLISWTRTQPQSVLNELMESMVRVTVGTGVRASADPDADKRVSLPQWAYIGGPRSVGRFTVASMRPNASTNEIIPVIPPEREIGVEIDLQLAQLTLKSSHLQALETAIASDPDVQMIFGKKSMQASTVQSSEHRLWVHLVGRDHDVQYWRTPDERTDIVELDRDYSPGEVEESEQWIVPILEPVRLTYMTKPFVLQICMPEKPIPGDAEVAMLIGIHPKLGGTWKEILVFKSLQMVQVYQVLSHGRRFYRVLEYTSDVRYTLRDMQPSTDDRRQLWPTWERHGAGHPYEDHWGNPLSCIVTRGSEYELNLSSGTETYIPERLLYGTVPQTLLEQYIFWQDEDDMLRGYPRDDKSPYMIEITLAKAGKVACSILSGVVGSIRRVLRKHAEESKALQVEFVAHLGGTIVSTTSAVSSNGEDDPSDMKATWKFGWKMMKRIRAIINSGVPLEDFSDFVDALRVSGMVYEDANVLVGEIEAFVLEQGGTLSRSKKPIRTKSDLAAAGAVGDSSLEQADLTLVNIAFARSESKFHKALHTISRLENAGYILCWTLTDALDTYKGNEDAINIDLLELPRLKMSFREKADEKGVPRLYSLDHVNLYISNVRSELTCKLMTGLPHSLLMTTSNGELQILVPTIDPVRPKIGSSPFTTELVMNRSDNPDWYGAVESTYFLYPVHVSLSFLFSPTLSSSLYLLLLRFLNRNYEDTFRLASTIGTDVEFSTEEDVIFQCLGRLDGDNHPDAHAARLKIALVIFDSPVSCPFDLTRQCSRYIQKLPHISAVCRISHAEELELLETCVCDSSDVRFFDPRTGKPRYTLHEVTIVKNRKYYLRALLAGKTSAETFLVPRGAGTNWPAERNIAAVMMDEGSFMSLEVQYSAPTQLSGAAVLEVVERFWSGMEVMNGEAFKLGFLFLYELLTGTKRAKFLSTDISSNLAKLLFELMNDKSNQELLPSILSMMTKYPHLPALMPKFKDTRKQKKVSIGAIGDDVDPISPLGTLLMKNIQVLQSEVASILQVAPEFNDHPVKPRGYITVDMTPSTVSFPSNGYTTSNGSHPDSNGAAAAAKDARMKVRSELFGKTRTMGWIIPKISDFSCDRRVLQEIVAPAASASLTETTKRNVDDLCLSLEEIQRFSGTPLASLGLENFIMQLQRSDLRQKPIDGTLPFDVAGHDQARSAIARSMLDRLKVDMNEYATAQNTELIPKLNFLANLDSFQMHLKALDPQADKEDSQYILSLGPDNIRMLRDMKQYVDEAISCVEEVISGLEKLRDVDTNYVEEALPWLLKSANSIDTDGRSESAMVPPPVPLASTKSELSEAMDVVSELPPSGLAADPADAERARQKQLFLLKRFARQEVTFWLEFLFGSLLSSTQTYDLTLLNPFLDGSAIELLTDVMVAAIFHANRVGIINRCIADCRDLYSPLRKLLGLISKQIDIKSNDYSSMISCLAAASLKGESLARNLTVGRHYVERVDKEGGPNRRQKRRRVDNIYDPRFLLFEFTWNIVLRQSQVHMIRDYRGALATGTGMVKQMIMGAGKTTVVCPLLTLMLGDGSSLIVQVVPPALLDFSRSVMRSTFSSIMHKRIYTLSFDRSTEADPALLKKLISAKRTCGVVITTPTTVKSIMLKFLELSKMITDNSIPRAQALEVDCAELGRTLQLFRESILIMDEVDLILHPMKSELNFPIGEKTELDFSPQRWQLPIHLIDGIFYAERGRMAVGFKQSVRAKDILDQLRDVIAEGYVARALQRNPHIVLLNLDWYHAKLLPIMADWMYMWLEAQHLAGMSEALIKKYLIEGTGHSRNADLAEAIQTRLSPNHKKMLNLGHDWLHSYLPHILQKIDRVSFGIMNGEDYDRAVKADPRMPRTRAKLAIPFVGKDVPSRSSEFAHPDVIIGLTVLAYRYEGLRWTDFEDIMNNLRSTLTKDLGPWSKRKSAIRYNRWVKEAGGTIFGEEMDESAGDGDNNENVDGNAMDVAAEPRTSHPVNSSDKVVVSLRLLKRSNEEQMRKLFDLLKLLPDAIHFYLENFIFPVYTDTKVVKLSAAGQELGGEMLFKKRIGFSGTPSDLLPVELGRCGYERCSDGQMIHVLTSPKVCSFEVVPEGWSPLSVLQTIATSESPRYNALIDTGALITGMTNLQVAQTLLKIGLPWCEGVVYLDEYDRKMVLVRATGRVLKMAQCGVPADKRFAFYDQVHTTGMDIQHVLDAKAVLTISKDMVFRDIAQGAYRMRGINKGQTIHIMVIPEVKDLIKRELSKARRITSPEAAFAHWELAASTSSGGQVSKTSMRSVLCDVNAWLVINSMRSERVQFNQLCLQNVANVYRKGAFASLLDGHKSLKISENYSPLLRKPLESTVQAPGQPDKWRLMDALQVFSEPIDFSLEECIPDVMQFSESIMRRVDANISFVRAEERGVIDDVISLITSGTNKSSNGQHVVTDSQSSEELGDISFITDEQERMLGAEMVQEQEQEQEQEKEQEQEQEIEIEKYVDLAYSREHEEPTPWPFSSLSKPTQASVPQFYPASAFKLYKRKPLSFPDYCLVSNNYFDCRWSGARRIKNVVMVLDWVPELDALAPICRSLEPVSSEQQARLDLALKLLDLDREGSYSLSQLRQVLKSALHVHLDDVEAEALMRECGGDAGTRAPVSAVRALLLSGRFSRTQEGRRFVAVSLAEAETIRCILHRRIGLSIIDGSNTAIALRCISTGFSIIDATRNFVGAAAETDASGRLAVSTSMDVASSAGAGSASALCPFMTDSAHESMRFLNCEMFFTERSLNTLLRSLYGTSKRERRTFFKNIISCRRRLAKKWNESSVAKLFTLSDIFGQLKQRAQSVCLREAIQKRGMLLYDAFSKFNFAKNGLLSPPEVWGTFAYLEIEMEALDILEFIAAADMDRDGNISYRELVDILADPDKQGTDADIQDLEETFTSDSMAQNAAHAPTATVDASGPTPSLQRQFSLTPVEPKGEAELSELQNAIMRREEEEERAETEDEGKEEARIRSELEAEEDEKDRNQEGGRNPKIGPDSAQYDFSTGRMPRFLNTRGDCNYRNDGMEQTYLKVFKQGVLLVRNPFKANCGGNRLNQYTLTLEIMMDKDTIPATSGGGGGAGGNAAFDPTRPYDLDADDELPDPNDLDMGVTGVGLSSGSASRSGNAGGSASAQQALFSTAEFAETDALMVLDGDKRVTISPTLPTASANASLSAGAASAQSRSSTRLTQNQWHFVTLVVDCIESSVELYLDGKKQTTMPIAPTSPEASEMMLGTLDGLWSLGSQFTLFGAKTAHLCSTGGNLRTLCLHPRCLINLEVEDLVAAMKREGQSGLVAQIVEQLVNFGFTKDIAEWAASNTEGASVEERVNAALTMLG